MMFQNKKLKKQECMDLQFINSKIWNKNIRNFSGDNRSLFDMWGKLIPGIE